MPNWFIAWGRNVQGRIYWGAGSTSKEAFLNALNS